MSNFQTLRDDYRAAKAALLTTIGASGASTRGVSTALHRLSALADATLQTLWQRAGCSSPFALLAVGGFGRAELFPHSDVDVLVLLPDDQSPDTNPELKARICLLYTSPSPRD